MHLARVSISLLTAGAIASDYRSSPGAARHERHLRRLGCSKRSSGRSPKPANFSDGSRRTNRVNVVARVTAFLDKRLFVEGAEVKTGDQLYRLERGPFEADLASKQAQVAQLQATLDNAKLTTDRARTLLGGPAGQQSTYDAAIANQRSLEAQVQSAQAQVQSSQINLDYTEIRSPIDGKIGRTAVTEGNVVSPEFGRADHHRQPGPDVRHVPGLGARGAGAARSLRDAGRLQGGGDQAPAAGRPPL